MLVSASSLSMRIMASCWLAIEAASAGSASPCESRAQNFAALVADRFRLAG
jgi:hypothetical protein